MLYAKGLMPAEFLQAPFVKEENSNGGKNMLYYDNHVHLLSFEASAEELIGRMDAAGIVGGNIFSTPPIGFNAKFQSDVYEKRISYLLDFTDGHRDRLFPILWIHPDEPDIAEKVEDAAARGVFGFKMICDNYFVYEDKCMKVLEKIAAVKKPVIFHSGILFDAKVSSQFNRPVNWEHCIEIPGLKFALCHCSWPWCDEVIALYGKFQSARITRPGLDIEMFLDLTPGTPRPYRKDLLTKLHTVGYDIGKNLLFGSDCRVEDYSADYYHSIRKMDDAIYEELELDQETIANIYGKNLRRFLGLPEAD